MTVRPITVWGYPWNCLNCDGAARSKEVSHRNRPSPNTYALTCTLAPSRSGRTDGLQLALRVLVRVLQPGYHRHDLILVRLRDFAGTDLESATQYCDSISKPHDLVHIVAD